MLERICRRCEVSKSLDAFYKKPKSRDGIATVCKACTLIERALHRAANADRIKQSDRARANNPDRVAARAAYRKTPEGKAAHHDAVLAYRRRHRQKLAAHNAVARAVAGGHLERWPACAVPECDCKNIEAHHPDYSMPLAVTWLCMDHHKEVHRMAKAAA